MISPEIYHFSEYDYLQALLIDPTSRSTLLPELDLSNKEHTDIPPPHVLICFSNLRSLTLSHNQIARFSAIKLLQGIPLLEKLDLSHNSISTLDDLTELGISKSLRSLNIIGNPIAKKYPRIRLVEFLLFPNKNKTYNPIEVLTATYNMASSNVEATRKHEIIVNRIPGTSKSKKGAYVVEDGQGKSAKLTQEMCPLPRNTRFPIMGIFNEEIISIRDIQTILVKKDISSVLFEKEESKGPKLFASEKLHLKYIEGYTRRKNRRKERIDLIPSLERLSQMIRSDDNMKLLYNQDKIRYDKLKLKKPDYEQELWNGPLDLQVDDGDFTIGITQLKQADKVLNEKKEAKKKYEKEHPRALKSYDDPNRQKALRKVEKMNQKEKNDGKGSEKTIPTSSEESSIPEQQSGNIKKSISFTEDESEEGSDEVEIENEEEIEDEESPVKVAPEKMALMRRSMSLPKYNKESIKNKQVLFDKEEGGKDEESIMASTAPLFKVRRTNSESMGFGTRAKTPGLVLEGLMRRSSAEKIDENVTSTRPVTQTNKRFVVVQDSVPNVGLPIYATNAKPKHVRSASVQPVIRKMSKDSIQLFEGIKIHSGIEGMAAERMPFFSEQEKGITITEKNKRMESRRNSQNSGNTLGLPYLECSKIKDENSLEQPFFSSNQGFNSMRSDLESEPREKIVIDDDYGNKNLIPDRAVDSCRGSAINSANSSMYRINFQSGLENAPSVSIAVNSFRRRDEDKNSCQVNQEGPLKLPKDELEHKTMEKEGFSRPNTTKSAFDLYNEIQGSLALNKLQVKVRPVKDRKPENENGTLKISNVVGNPENGNKGHSRTRSSITISSVQQKDKQMSHRDKKVGQRIMIQELVSNLSPQTSFLSSRLSKNNNHSLAYLRKLRTFGNNLTNRNLAIQGEQIEEVNFPEKVKMLKIGSKEEGGLDSTTAFSSRDKFKSRSSSVENFKSPSGIQIVNNQTDKKKIRSVRLKQAL